ncbi:hypothetical protein HDV06_003310 [Boothiomyces sp. JEL0866]|nr:hypothetical protein HDV06_003310 [Boothiomyces sp. JEL0866]
MLDSILVIGGSAGIGRCIVLEALADPFFIKVGVLSRKHSASLDELVSLGAQVNVIDYTDLQLLESHMKGYKVVVAIHNTYGNIDDAKSLIDTAKKAGVSRFVPNVWGVDYEVNSVFPWLGPRLEIRKHLEMIGLDYTEIILGFFMENIQKDGISGCAIDFANRKAVFYGNKPVSWTLRRDGAKFLLSKLKNQEGNHRYRIEGDRRSFQQVVDMVEQKLGTFTKEYLTDALEKYNQIEDPFDCMAGLGRGVSNPSGEELDGISNPTTVESWLNELFQ